MTLQVLHSEFPYIWGKFDFLFYQWWCLHRLTTVCNTIIQYTTSLFVHFKKVVGKEHLPIFGQIFSIPRVNCKVSNPRDMLGNNYRYFLWIKKPGEISRPPVVKTPLGLFQKVNKSDKNMDSMEILNRSISGICHFTQSINKFV
jgi:hypothetical protein